jgi:hypothetical protein
MKSTKTFVFQRPTTEPYSNTVKYISKKGNLRAKMPVSHSIYKSILATMRDNKVSIIDVLSGNVPLKVNSGLAQYSDANLTELFMQFIDEIDFIDEN